MPWLQLVGCNRGDRIHFHRGEVSSDRDPWIEIPLFPSLSPGNKRECCSWALQFVSIDSGLPCILISIYIYIYLQRGILCSSDIFCDQTSERNANLCQMSTTHLASCVWINPASLQSTSVPHISAILKISAVKKIAVALPSKSIWELTLMAWHESSSVPAHLLRASACPFSHHQLSSEMCPFQ